MTDYTGMIEKITFAACNFVRRANETECDHEYIYESLKQVTEYFTSEMQDINEYCGYPDEEYKPSLEEIAEIKNAIIQEMFKSDPESIETDPKDVIIFKIPDESDLNGDQFGKN